MKFLRVPVGIAVAVVLALTASCLQPGQHTLVAITGAHSSSRAVDVITFTFAQGAPPSDVIRFVTQPPMQPSGKRVDVDGRAFLYLVMTSAVAHDQRGAPTAPAAFYAVGLKNVLEVARVEDFEGYVSYAFGLLDPHSPAVRVTRSATSVVVTVAAPG